MKIKRLISIAMIVFLASVTLTFQSFVYKHSAAPVGSYLPLDTFLTSKSIEATVRSLGSHQKECVVLDFTNLTSDTILFFLEPGRRLVSKDSTQQDILIVKERQICLPPFASFQMKGYGFCCQSRKASPKINAVFSIGYMAPEPWVRLARLISKNNFSSGAVQHAIWVLSDDHPIGSIFEDGAEDLYPLREMVANIKGIAIPWYAVKYEKDSDRLFSGRPEKITGVFKYYLKNNSIITITIRNKQGQLIRTLVKGSPTGPGHHEYILDLNLKGWPNGVYYVFVHMDHSNLVISKSFVL
jgi:hypothetical protein